MMTGSLARRPAAPLSLEDLKQQAKRLRAGLADQGEGISHSRSLELVAHQHGYKDWNTIHAAIGNQPPPCPLTIGQNVTGRYLGQSFAGEVIGVQLMIDPGRFRATVQFDDPVDVVEFESFSNFRSRVTSIINGDGVSAEKLSNGLRQMVIDL